MSPWGDSADDGACGAAVGKEARVSRERVSWGREEREKRDGVETRNVHICT